MNLLEKESSGTPDILLRLENGNGLPVAGSEPLVSRWSKAVESGEKIVLSLAQADLSGRQAEKAVGEVVVEAIHHAGPGDVWSEIFISIQGNGNRLVEPVVPIRLRASEDPGAYAFVLPYPIELRAIEKLEIGLISEKIDAASLAITGLVFRHGAAKPQISGPDLLKIGDEMLLGSEGVLVGPALPRDGKIVKEVEFIGATGWADKFLSLNIAGADLDGGSTAIQSVSFAMCIESRDASAAWAEIGLVLQSAFSDWQTLEGKASLRDLPVGVWRTLTFDLPLNPTGLVMGQDIRKVIAYFNSGSAFTGKLLLRGFRFSERRQGSVEVVNLGTARPISFADADLINPEFSERPVSFRHQLERIHDFVAGKRFTATLEVGLAVGGSACYIMAATGKPHVAIDPFQGRAYKNKGLGNIKKYGFEAGLEFYEEYSHCALPKLAESGRKFDFIYIDGNHKFDVAFVDFYFSSLMLKPDGFILLDDAQMGGVEKIVNFIRLNLDQTHKVVGELYPGGVLVHKVAMRAVQSWDFYREF